MNKILKVLLASLVIFSMTACSGETKSNDVSKQPDVNSEDVQEQGNSEDENNDSEEVKEDTNSDEQEENLEDVDKADDSKEENSNQEESEVPEKTILIPSKLYTATIQKDGKEIMAGIYLSTLDNKASVQEVGDTSYSDGENSYEIGSWFEAEYTADGNMITICITDDLASELNTYMFEKSGDTLIFKAASSDTLYYAGNMLEPAGGWIEPVEDGTVFYYQSADARLYETMTYTDGYSTLEIDVDAMTIKYTNTDGIDVEGALTFNAMGGIHTVFEDCFMITLGDPDCISCRLYSNKGSGIIAGADCLTPVE